MIFVTIGTQLPFPRLVGAMDALAPALEEPVIAQVGPDTATRRNLEIHKHLHPAQFEELCRAARVIVAHAGIGTVLTAKRLRRPLILVPRRFDAGEHRNDHQLATAKELEGLTGIRIAWKVEDLPEMLGQRDPAPADPALGAQAESLIARLRDFIGPPGK